jgi:hypothetical protein
VADRASGLVIALAVVFAGVTLMRRGVAQGSVLPWLPGILLAAIQVLPWTRSTRHIAQLLWRDDGGGWHLSTSGADSGSPVRLGRGSRTLGASVVLEIEGNQLPGWGTRWYTPWDVAVDELRRWNVVLQRGGRFGGS